MDENEKNLKTFSFAKKNFQVRTGSKTLLPFLHHTIFGQQRIYNVSSQKNISSLPPLKKQEKKRMNILMNGNILHWNMDIIPLINILINKILYKCFGLKYFDE